MKKCILSVVLAVTMVVGSFNVVFAVSKSKVLIDADYAYATAYAECNYYDGYASTDFYPTDSVISRSSYVSAKIYDSDYYEVDSGSDSSSSAGTLNVSVELSCYTSEAIAVRSNHEVTLDGVNISTELTASK